MMQDRVKQVQSKRKIKGRTQKGNYFSLQVNRFFFYEKLMKTDVTSGNLDLKKKIKKEKEEEE